MQQGVFRLCGGDQGATKRVEDPDRPLETFAPLRKSLSGANDNSRCYAAALACGKGCFASAEATKGQRKGSKTPVAPWKPSHPYRKILLGASSNSRCYAAALACGKGCFASAEAIKGQRKGSKTPVAPWKPSHPYRKILLGASGNSRCYAAALACGKGISLLRRRPRGNEKGRRPRSPLDSSAPFGRVFWEQASIVGAMRQHWRAAGVSLSRATKGNEKGRRPRSPLDSSAPFGRFFWEQAAIVGAMRQHWRAARGFRSCGSDQGLSGRPWILRRNPSEIS